MSVEEVTAKGCKCFLVYLRVQYVIVCDLTVSELLESCLRFKASYRFGMLLCNYETDADNFHVLCMPS